LLLALRAQWQEAVQSLLDLVVLLTAIQRALSEAGIELFAENDGGPGVR